MRGMREVERVLATYHTLQHHRDSRVLVQQLVKIRCNIPVGNSLVEVIGRTRTVPVNLTVQSCRRGGTPSSLERT